MENSKSTNILAKIGKLLYYIVIAFICLIALFLLYYIISSQMNANNDDYKPKVSIYTIVSPSMTPAIKVYDVVINIREDNPENIKVGDIITYVSKAPTSEGMTITHRVIEVSELPDGGYEYQTQGDNNSEPDKVYVNFDQVIGKEILIIPYLGKIQFLIANQKGWLFLLLIPVSIYMFIEIYKLFNLFSIKNKVNNVVNENNNEELDRQQEEMENARKEKIKEELKIKSAMENPLPLPTTPEEIAQYKKDTVEVLDTDPLTTRIKEYDDRINQLDKVLKRMEKESSIAEKEPATLEKEEVEEDEQFLKGSHIKVTRMEEAKKGRKKIGIKEKERNNQIVDITYEEKKGNEDLNDIIPLENSREKIERPVSEDIVSKENNNRNRKALNLNPRNVKRVRRPNRNTNTNSSNRTNNGNRSLNLNPRGVKRVNRNRPKPKKKLIVIEKQK